MDIIAPSFTISICIVNSNRVLLLQDSTPKVELFKDEHLWLVMFTSQSFNCEPNIIENSIQIILKSLSLIGSSPGLLMVEHEKCNSSWHGMGERKFRFIPHSNEPLSDAHLWQCIVKNSINLSNNFSM